MEPLLSGYSVEELKNLFNSKQSYKKDNYLEKNGRFINKNIHLESLDEEIFEPHPYLPIQASNYGNIKCDGKILDQEISSEGYTYVNVCYEIDKLVNETKESKKRENNMSTPRKEEAIKYEINEKYSKYDYFDDHPFICIGVNKESKIVNKRKIKEFESNKEYENPNFCRPFKEKEKNGIKYVDIPIHVYRLVAETWLENPNYKTYGVVHHISNDRRDNTIYNLMWVDNEQHYNIQIDKIKNSH